MLEQVCECIVYKQLSDGFKAEIYEQADDVGGTWYWNDILELDAILKAWIIHIHFQKNYNKVELERKIWYTPEPEYAQYVCKKFKLRIK